AIQGSANSLKMREPQPIARLVGETRSHCLTARGQVTSRMNHSDSDARQAAAHAGMPPQHAGGTSGRVVTPLDRLGAAVGFMFSNQFAGARSAAICLVRPTGKHEFPNVRVAVGYRPTGRPRNAGNKRSAGRLLRTCPDRISGTPYWRAAPASSTV